MFAQRYRGFTIHKGRCPLSFSVDLNGRTRWGTLQEVRSDVDAHLARGLAPIHCGSR